MAELGEDLVANLVTMRIVEDLEVVDVEHDDGQRSRVADTAGDLCAQVGLEPAAIGEAGQRIRVTHLIGPLMEASSFNCGGGLAGQAAHDVEGGVVDDACDVGRELEDADDTRPNDHRYSQARRGEIDSMFSGDRAIRTV